jgi:tRNA(Ile2) C34 agmatinyltransferase TiaS
MWSPATNTITYNPDEEQAAALLLHEVGHALLQHNDYKRDVALVAMETDAWEEARKLAKTFAVSLDDEHVESHLDTYREWLHKRSTCPHCEATGLQVGAKLYRCLACTHEWRVNEARICALRRYSTD